MVGVFIMALNVSIILEVIVHKDPFAYPRDYTSVWPFMPKIGFAFEYQVYFMIIFPYLDN
jgi:hypothetical protein